MAQVFTDPVGFVKVDVYRDGLTMISVPLEAADKRLNDGENPPAPGSIGEMVAENLKGGPSGGESDEIFKWDATLQRYKAAFLVEFPGTTFDGTWFDPDAAAVSDMTFSAGEAMWIDRKSAGEPTETITFLGWVPMEGTRSVTFLKGLSMFGYPFPVTVAINDTNLNEPPITGGPSSGEADTVYAWDPVNGRYDAAFLVDFAGSPFHGKWFDPDANDLSAITFDPGSAAWFDRYPDNPATWLVPRPY